MRVAVRRADKSKSPLFCTKSGNCSCDGVVPADWKQRRVAVFNADGRCRLVGDVVDTADAGAKVVAVAQGFRGIQCRKRHLFPQVGSFAGHNLTCLQYTMKDKKEKKKPCLAAGL